MVHLKLTCFLGLCLSLVFVCGEIRGARSPQFGGISHAGAQAQAGTFGRPNFGPRPPIIAPRPPVFAPQPPIFGGGLARPGSSISISKSVSINSGGGSASSIAGSQASGKKK